jgi:hypothetical protein
MRGTPQESLSSLKLPSPMPHLRTDRLPTANHLVIANQSRLCSKHLTQMRTSSSVRSLRDLKKRTRRQLRILLQHNTLRPRDLRKKSKAYPRMSSSSNSASLRRKNKLLPRLQTKIALKQKSLLFLRPVSRRSTLQNSKKYQLNLCSVIGKKWLI